MWARILGSAAGGGFPQWNCSCRNCDGARTGRLPVRARTQAALAVSGDRRGWFLVNATPDIGAHLARLAEPAAAAGGGSAGGEARGSTAGGEIRRSPVRAVLLTDAELDHTAGLLSLREGDGLTVYATAAVFRAAAPLLAILGAYQPVLRRVLEPGVDTPLDGYLSVRALPTGSTKLPRYAAHLPADPAGVVGYVFTGRGGAVLVYLPCVPELTPDLVTELEAADCALVDGTCWTDDEMALVGRPEKTSRSMGHAPVTGPGGTLPVLAGLATPRRIYTHLNNTNPLLVEDSAARRAVEAAGVEVAHDGMEFAL
ncbi:coenzyme PQQ synthesis protein B [Longispora fulva]|uniref:Coenzyme PQQ synthesis protein B n=1 Tax=Longispora fulva TaxID=619741 RepID=A0A8J7GGR4_9ACTN|nr:MBL fold metallo-hydrolase [Longispora fulva]MBG6137651.1 pyrroloquinoline quinone biosynthesis protein B [Longispora fulva]GIG62190.1 coenzyme PQQ synthesis protein B [Longispora fulva]